MARVDNTGGSGFNVDNGTGLVVRTKLNQIIAALSTLSQGSGTPTIGLSAYTPFIDGNTFFCSSFLIAILPNSGCPEFIFFLIFSITFLISIGFPNPILPDDESRSLHEKLIKENWTYRKQPNPKTSLKKRSESMDQISRNFVWDFSKIESMYSFNCLSWIFLKMYPDVGL